MTAAQRLRLAHGEAAPLRLQALLADLGPRCVRSHRRHAVALQQVVSLQARERGDALLRLPDGSGLPWSRAWRQALIPLSSPWRMRPPGHPEGECRKAQPEGTPVSLLFLVSGATTACMRARDGATSTWLCGRARRRLLPLLLGALLIVAPQSDFELRERFGYGGSFSDFMALYWSAHGSVADPRGRLVLPTWNLLWFLPC